MKNKSELCQSCGKCCQCIVLPVVKPLQKSESVFCDWIDVRGCKIIKATDDTLYIEINSLCPNLSKSDGKYRCEIYYQRPEGCRIFDGSKYDWLNCAWKNEENDMEKSVLITTIDEEFEKAAKASGKIGMRKFVGKEERKRQAKRESARKKADKRGDIQAYGFEMGED
jgi:Fe-S-cluster containining protein